MRIGFSGTRKGITAHQKESIRRIFFYGEKDLSSVVIHHGGCTGADKEFHWIVRPYNPARIFVHPSNAPRYQAYCPADPPTVFRFPEAPLLVRNKDIVDSVDVLLYAPETSFEQRVGEMWFTVRYARKVGLEIYQLLPDEPGWAEDVGSIKRIEI
jgi:hypothetical protein